MAGYTLQVQHGDIVTADAVARIEVAYNNPSAGLAQLDRCYQEAREKITGTMAPVLGIEHL